MVPPIRLFSTGLASILTVTLLLGALQVLWTAPALAYVADANATSSGPVNPYSLGTYGYDISYPQCGQTSFPATSWTGQSIQYAILGVNGGRPFTANPCLTTEFQIVANQGLPTSFYINLQSPETQSTGALPVGPRGACATSDSACIGYNYGWSAAQDAYTSAQQDLQSVGSVLTPSAWWLDVETGNYWSRDSAMNDAVIQGALDFFQQTPNGTIDLSPVTPTLLSVGIYSTTAMWDQIAGPSYQPGVPTWVPGARSLTSASRLSTPVSFTGGPVWLVQATNGQLDENYAPAR